LSWDSKSHLIAEPIKAALERAVQTFSRRRLTLDNDNAMPLFPSPEPAGAF